MQSSKSRIVSAFGIVLALALALAGCTSGAQNVAPPTKASGSSAVATPAQRSTVSSEEKSLKDLRVGLANDNTDLRPDRANIGMEFPLITEPLLVMDSDYQIKPWLAQSYEYRGNNTWRFVLRKGVKFHDGSELTARDVKWTLDRVARAGGRTIRAGADSTVVVDDYTVDFTPSKPNLKVPLQIVHPYLGILKEGTDPMTKTVGTGPFKFVDYKQGEYLKVERYDQYWGEKARVRTITFRYIPDNEARAMALQAGDVDLIAHVPRESAKALREKKGLTVITSPVGAYEALMCSIHGQGEYATLGDIKLRQALAMAIDREAIVEKVWEENAEVSQTVVPARVLGAYASLVKGIPCDPTAAAKALDELGWKVGTDGVREKAGQKLSLTLINGFPDAAIHRPVPEVLQTQLRAVGVDVRIVETTDYTSALKEGKGHLWLEAGNQNDANPAFLPGLLWSKTYGAPEYSALFAPGGKAEEYMKQAFATPDVEATRLHTAQAMHELVDEQVVVIPLAGLYNIWAGRAEVKGFQPHASRVNTQWNTVYVAE